jgi:hypothetical protein
MRRALIVAAATAALAMGITSAAVAAPMGPVSPPAAEGSADLVVKTYGGRYYGYRRGPSFGFYLGAPAVYGYSRRCWWSYRYHRRVCSIY